MKNIGLKIIIIILSIVVLILIGYVIYDKVLNNELLSKENINNGGNPNIENNNTSNNNNIDIDNDETNNNQNTAENNNVSVNQNMGEHIELDNNVKTELTEIFKFTYNYYDWGNGYCGSYSYDDQIDADTNSNANFYIASSKYNTFNEMISHLKEYMTEHVIYGKHYMSSDAYIEKDGKLYCPNFGKGGNIYQLKEITIKYSKPYERVIYTVIETRLTTDYDDYSMHETYDVTFSRKDNRWIISSYEKIDVKY